MRLPGRAPNGIWAGADARENLRARGATTQLPRLVRQSRKEGPRNVKQIRLPVQDNHPPAPHVIDDLPDVVPVGPQEIDVIETYLRPVLNGLLGALE